MNNKGFILLTSILVLTAISSMVILEMTALVFSQYQYTFNEISKEVSKALAFSCRNEALLRIAKDPNYRTLNESVRIGSSSCKIVAIEDVASPLKKIIKTSASSSNIVSNRLTQITIQNNGLIIDSSIEVEKF